jgi:predicted DNA-binding protein
VTHKDIKNGGVEMQKKRQSVRFYPELITRLKLMSSETDIAMNRIIERALEEYIDRYDFNKLKNVKSKAKKVNA